MCVCVCVGSSHLFVDRRENECCSTWILIWVDHKIRNLILNALAYTADSRSSMVLVCDVRRIHSHTNDTQKTNKTNVFCSFCGVFVCQSIATLFTLCVLQIVHSSLNRSSAAHLWFNFWFRVSRLQRASNKWQFHLNLCIYAVRPQNWMSRFHASLGTGKHNLCHF